MDENFIKTSTPSDSGSSENSGNISSLSRMSIPQSLTSIKTDNVTNESEYQSFFNDDFTFSRLSTMARW
jgi:hypothetical protein